MKLYKILVTQNKAFFGTPENRIERDVTIIAQTPSCNAFLLLSKDEQDGLELLSTVPSGFDFTYCQEWGLTLNAAVLARTILDIRKKAYGSIESQLDLLYHDMTADKGDKTGEWYKAMKAVKTANPK